MKMFQAVRDAQVSLHSKRAHKPWYLRQTAAEIRAAMTPEQREAAFDSFIARHGSGAGRGRGDV